jgi:hypothetical protein
MHLPGSNSIHYPALHAVADIPTFRITVPNQYAGSGA